MCFFLVYLSTEPYFFFFFQAEDGIRDRDVTGVQTCALPICIEALSRGAAHVTFVERAPAALRVLRGNLERLGIAGGFRIHPGSTGAFLRSAAETGPKPERYEVVFLDPPYDAVREVAATLSLLGGA